MTRRAGAATVADVHELAHGMPHVERIDGPAGNAVYTIRRKSFVFFRNPRPDAVDSETGERYDDVIVLWVESEEDKRALVRTYPRPSSRHPTSTATPRC